MVDKIESKLITKENIKDRFNIMSADELINSDIPEQRWIVKDLIPEQSIIMWTGQKASFKSFFNKYLGICIATGTKVLDTYEVVRKGTVLYIDEENGNRRLKARITKICNGLEINTEELIDFHSVIKQGFKLDETNKTTMKLLEHIIIHYKPIFIVFDSLVRMMTGDENSSQDVRKIYNNLSPLMEKYNCAFSLIHHSCKDGKGFRGSGDFEFMADKTFFVGRNKKSRTDFVITQEKERDNEFVNKIGFTALDSEDHTAINIENSFVEPDFEEEKDVSVIEDYANKLIEAIKANKISVFKTKEAKTLLDAQGLTAYDTQTKAIKYLRKNHIIEKQTRGVYKVK
jgi:RecA-family ATPase